MSDAAFNRSDPIMADLAALCDFGGRQSGTPSEAAARDWLAKAGAEALDAPCRPHSMAYDGWRAVRSELHVDGRGTMPCHPLLRSEATPAGGIEAEVVDLGRGLKADFDAVGDDLQGRIAMVAHEVMFSTDTFHRRRKLELAREAGAVGALVASRIAGQPVAGSARADEPGLPALGVTPEAAVALRSTPTGRRRARIVVETATGPTEATNLLFDRPGATGKWIVLSAHYDGHDIGESALDNATGVAICLEVARRLSARCDFDRHGLRLAFFTVEEWGLLGSKRYLADLPDAAAASMLLNLNADTVVGGRGLTALTSGFGGLSQWIAEEARRMGRSLGVHEPLQTNSDHANFVRHGVPALRFVSGFNEPESDVKYVLTGRDRRDLANPEALADVADFIEDAALAALSATDETAAAWRS